MKIPTDAEILAKLKEVEGKDIDRVDLISLQDYLSSSKKYPERVILASDEVKANAIILLKYVNAFLQDLNIDSVSVSSGFRPIGVNAIIGGSKKSGHTLGLSIDLLDDKSQTLAKKCSLHSDLLRKYSLFLENPIFTKGTHSNWIHLDIIDRPDRPNRQFNP